MMSRIKQWALTALAVVLLGGAISFGPTAPAFADPGSNPTDQDSHGEHITMAVEHHGSVAQAAEDHDVSVKDFQSEIASH
ncbi:MAG: hypothetical protein Q8P59_07030 [Dehalococcoidia bacterium]|nr:hypothetical protein [Dehalococcoidia bacterium]